MKPWCPTMRPHCLHVSQPERQLKRWSSHDYRTTLYTAEQTSPWTRFVDYWTSVSVTSITHRGQRLHGRCSPDLSPFVNVWSIMKLKKRQQRPLNCRTAEVDDQQEWERISLSNFNNYCRQFTNHSKKRWPTQRSHDPVTWSCLLVLSVFSPHLSSTDWRPSLKVIGWFIERSLFMDTLLGSGSSSFLLIQTQRQQDLICSAATTVKQWVLEKKCWFDGGTQWNQG